MVVQRRELSAEDIGQIQGLLAVPAGANPPVGKRPEPLLQKMYLKPNCISRIVRAVVILPNVAGVRTSPAGALKFG